MSTKVAEMILDDLQLTPVQAVEFFKRQQKAAEKSRDAARKLGRRQDVWTFDGVAQMAETAAVICGALKGAK